jgi:hypothetical protein
MQFKDRDEGEYRIHEGAMEDCTGKGFIAAVVVDRVSGQTAAREVYRDTALSGGHKWLTSDQALARALEEGIGAVAAHRRRECERDGRIKTSADTQNLNAQPRLRMDPRDPSRRECRPDA